MNVKDFIEQNKHEKCTLWLCPSVVYNDSVNPKPLEQGLEFQNYGSIPTELLDKEVVKYWKEEEFNCVIWKNI